MHNARHAIAIKIIECLENHGFKAMLAGGCVRDHLLGLQPEDYDIATDANPEDVLMLFKQAGIKVIPTGIEHGTVTVVINKVPTEITTLREDLTTDGRRATVAFGASFEKDAERRDFTINAMFESKTGDVIDYFGGKEDLQKKVIRFVGNPDERITEDYLRILRFFRFWGRFGFTGDNSGLAAITKNAHGLKQISQERITSELRKIIMSPFAATVGPVMEKSGILSLIIDDWQDGKDKWLPLEQLQAADWQGHLFAMRFALLLHRAINPRDEKLTKKLLKDLKLSNNELEQILIATKTAINLSALGTEAPDSSFMAIADQIDAAFGSTKFSLLFAKTWWPLAKIAPQAMIERFIDIEANKNSLRLAKPLVDGAAIMAHFNLESGPVLGRLLDKLKSAQRNGEISTPEQALGYANKLLKTDD